jgi:hypothetical protein
MISLRHRAEENVWNFFNVDEAHGFPYDAEASRLRQAGVFDASHRLPQPNP